MVPPAFAAAGGQASVLDGRIVLFTAQSPAFLNRVYNPGAVTADWPPVSNPTGISINNAFGRPWFTSVPDGPKGVGTQSVIDPDGRPLDGAPSKVAGGVFAGVLTNRVPQQTQGAMTSGALATALLGKSPDGGGRAVFAGLHADGSLVQIHVEKGVDGLAPAGTITPFDPGPRVSRSGMVFNWVPNAILYVADPAGNTIVALSLVTENGIFRVDATRRLGGTALDLPVDLAPAVAEIANPAFSSNTRLAGSADLYVVNRGNGTIARMKQDGTVGAVRRVTLPGVGVVGPGHKGPVPARWPGPYHRRGGARARRRGGARRAALPSGRAGGPRGPSRVSVAALAATPDRAAKRVLSSARSPDTFLRARLDQSLRQSHLGRMTPRLLDGAGLTDELRTRLGGAYVVSAGCS